MSTNFINHRNIFEIIDQHGWFFFFFNDQRNECRETLVQLIFFTRLNLFFYIFFAFPGIFAMIMYSGNMVFRNNLFIFLCLILPMIRTRWCVFMIYLWVLYCVWWSARMTMLYHDPWPSTAFGLVGLLLADRLPLTKLVTFPSIRPGRSRIDQLARNVRYFRQRLTQLGYIIYGHDASPVVPLLTYLIPKLT